MPEVLEHRDPVVRPTAPGARAAAPPARNDVTVFRAALAVVALAVADDAFIHPEPGVTAGDHLASGLVPLAGAALLIAIAPRLCTVVRAWLAIFVGALAIVGGVTDGVRHIAVDRVSGDDVTAVLAGVAGIVLVALGVATLWRTRRTAGSLGRRLGRRTLGASPSSRSPSWSFSPPGSRSSRRTRRARPSQPPRSVGSTDRCS